MSAQAQVQNKVARAGRTICDYVLEPQASGSLQLPYEPPPASTCLIA
jgi:hypothetical protein